jgi:SAM-dependent methyltransferase
VAKLPFDSRCFDVVVAVTVLCFLKAPDAAVGELARVLRPGGRLVIGALGRWSVWAAERRLRGRLGDEVWRGARFWTRRGLDSLLRGAELRPVSTGSAVFFPPNAALAKLCRPLEAALRNRTTLGAAFLTVRGDKT